MNWPCYERRDLTNAQFPILNSHLMGIENWELSIGQILFPLLTVRRTQ
jgi:hypothetical protein